MPKPLLILQMQRMGDLILSFPLILDLLQKYPTHPIWVVAEKIFFESLTHLAPPVTFFSPDVLSQISTEQYLLAINLSFRQEACAALGKIKAEEKFGPYIHKNNLYVQGFWHLYRHSLTQNNRHNTFHWADLARLDLYPNLLDYGPRVTSVRRTVHKRIALVLGASSPFKHPNAAFWIALANKLIQAGFMPFLIGGKQEATLGATVAKAIQIEKLNLCGQLPLPALVTLLKTVDLCITPDTGPMHLANWLGIPILNLSMGPVRAYETGPYAPNQTVVLPHRSCAGCWQCQYRHFACKNNFHPTTIAKIALDIIHREELQPQVKLKLAKTTLDDLGLATLNFLTKNPNAEQRLDAVWRNFFLALICQDRLKVAKLEMQQVAQNYPKLYAQIHAELKKVLSQALLNLKKPNQYLAISYKQTSPAIRLFTGFLEMYAQNNNFTREALEKICSWLAMSLDLLTV